MVTGDIYSFLTQKPSRYFIQSLEEGEVLHISKDDLETLYIKSPKMERYFRTLVQNAYVSFQNRMISPMSKPALERYLEFIGTYPGLDQRIP